MPSSTNVPADGSVAPSPSAAIDILLVDDESEVTRMLGLRLSKRGYNCSAAASGEQALDMVRQKPPHLVVLDVKMPGMDGMEVLRRLRGEWPQVLVILLSGHADMQMAVSAMQNGAFGYLMKPVEFEELLFKVEDACTQLRLESHI